MKKTFFNYIKLTLALFLFLQAGRVEAQGTFINWTFPTSSYTSPMTGTYTGGTVTVSNTGTGSDLKFYAPGVLGGVSDAQYISNLNGATVNQSFLTSGANSNPLSKSITFTFSNPVLINELNIADINFDNSFFDKVTFSTSFSAVTGASCTYTTSGATPTSGWDSNNTNTHPQWARWTNPTTASKVTSFTINYPGNGTVSSALIFYSMKVTSACVAGFSITAPTLKATTIKNTCPSNTVDLNSLVSSTLPANTQLKWYTDIAHTTAVATPTAAAAGTYYAFYVDATNNCFTNASAAVTASISLCPLELSNTCPTSSSVDLANSLASTNVVPAGFTITYHSGTPATTANKLPSSIVTTSGTYYGAYYLPGQDCYTETSRKLVVTIKNCCDVLPVPTWN